MEKTMSTINRASLVSSLAVLAALAAGCSSSPEGTEGAGAASGPAPADVTVGIRSDIDTFDPWTTLGDFGAQQSLRLTYTTLVRRTVGGEIVPQTATSWKVTSRSGVFQIRKDQTCSDGSALTPSVIEKSFTALVDPKTGSKYASRAFPGGGATFASDDTAGTFTIKLKHPNSDLLASLANVGQIVCGPGLTDPSKRASAPSGAGPYTLASSKRGNAYVFERRNDFTALPKGTSIKDMPAKLTLRVVADDSAMVNAILTGEVDTGSVFGRDGERLEKGGEFNDVRGVALSGEGLTFNHTKGLPGADQAFRAAVSLAIDPKLYNRAATFGRGKTIQTVYTSNMDCYSKENASIVPTTDVSGAAAALDKAGYQVTAGRRTMPDGSPLTVRLVGYTDQNNGPQYLADVLRKLKLDVDTSVAPKDQALETVFANKFDVFVYPFESSLGTPTQIVGGVRGDLKTSVNVAHIDNARYNAAADKAASDVEKRCEYWQEGERALLEDSEVKPLAQPTAYYYAKGLTFDATFYLIDPYTIRSSS
jgi:peptide/nickel transport system substrate-binding protein